jgi:hypothetical protein
VSKLAALPSGSCDEEESFVDPFCGISELLSSAQPAAMVKQKNKAIKRDEWNFISQKYFTGDGGKFFILKL